MLAMRSRAFSWAACSFSRVFCPICSQVMVEHLSSSSASREENDRPGHPPDPMMTDASGSARFVIPSSEDVWQLGIFARSDTSSGFDSFGVGSLDPTSPVEIVLSESRELTGWVEVPEDHFDMARDFVSAMARNLIALRREIARRGEAPLSVPEALRAMS